MITFSPGTSMTSSIAPVLKFCPTPFSALLRTVGSWESLTKLPYLHTGRYTLYRHRVYSVQNMSYGVACTCYVVIAIVAQSYLTLCDPMDCNLPSSKGRGIFLGKNIGVGCHFLLWGIFPTQGSNPGLLHCRQILYHWATREAWVFYIYLWFAMQQCSGVNFGLVWNHCRVWKAWEIASPGWLMGMVSMPPTNDIKPSTLHCAWQKSGMEQGNRDLRRYITEALLTISKWWKPPRCPYRGTDSKGVARKLPWKTPQPQRGTEPCPWQQHGRAWRWSH